MAEIYSENEGWTARVAELRNNKEALSTEIAQLRPSNENVVQYMNNVWIFTSTNSQ